MESPGSDGDSQSWSLEPDYSHSFVSPNKRLGVIVDKCCFGIMTTASVPGVIVTIQVIRYYCPRVLSGKTPILWALGSHLSMIQPQWDPAQDKNHVEAQVLL